MRFPLRRNNINERLAVLRLPGEDGDRGTQPEALPFARFATPLPEHEPLPASEPGPPALPFTMPLKGQFTGADSRADRLVRQIRGEVNGLRQTIEQLSAERGDMLEVDLAAVMADPQAAASLPPAALVRALIAAGERANALEAQLAHEEKKASKVRSRLRKARMDFAETSGRLETLEEVIAALHANLEDLRGASQHARALEAPSAPHELRSAPAELPSPFPAWVEHD